MHNLTLKHFILRKQVLDLYRHAIRSSRVIPNRIARRETIAWIRSELERNKYITDVHVIEDKLKVGRREINEILPSAQNR
ncbi:hypothetical protein Moror_113 [Moniliophthora roreri MCA 2997]|uniref:LYR motif-containing protein 2 n=1 Tax=Moniliophthora roreri (strain MCA 2997) TaxID=1381753 RepID=V2XGN0_MONRO|nr:hypothetical protein Moror_113 [Moniliophthora roreri MCA 2997]KAI3622597.1 hypothetical protein WG66_015476 [Moniliophthora roreri]